MVPVDSSGDLEQCSCLDHANQANRRPLTNQRRGSCFNDIIWVKAELRTAVTEAAFPPASALIGYGKHLFYIGLPKNNMYAETINSVIDCFPTYRGQISGAWATLTAAVSLGLLWQWPRFVGALLLGFHGLLRPSEILPLKRSSLVFPRVVLSTEGICYVRILRSKTRRFILRQHYPYIAIFGCVAKTESLFDGSSSVYSGADGIVSSSFWASLYP